MILTTASSRPALPALRGWPLFIALSLLVHVLLFLLLTLFAPERLPLGEHVVAPLAVQIETAAQPQPAHKAVTAQRHATPEKAAEPVATPKLRQEAIAPPTVKPSNEVSQPPALAVPDRYDERNLGTSQRLLDSFPGAGGPAMPPQGDQPPDDETRLQIESLIRTRFADHFVYPLMAQRHGWQGEVILSFRIHSDGTITTVQVERSSGHTILDQAALDSLRAIKRIEFTPGTTLRHMLELRMPVIYHLAQG